MKDTISVVIPVYDGERYISQAIESALEQTLPPDEILVVDDGSTDLSVKAAKQTFLGIRVLSLPHGGVSAARNAGARAAGGKYLAFLDADDLWEPRKLALQHSAALERPEAKVILCRTRDFLSPDLPREEQNRYFISGESKAGYCAGCVFMRQEDFLVTGGFPEDRSFFEASLWFSHLREQDFSVYVLDELLMHRRIHGNNTMLRRKAEANAAYFQLIRERLNRKNPAE